MAATRSEKIRTISRIVRRGVRHVALVSEMLDAWVPWAEAVLSFSVEETDWLVNLAGGSDLDDEDVDPETLARARLAAQPNPLADAAPVIRCSRFWLAGLRRRYEPVALDKWCVPSPLCPLSTGGAFGAVVVHGMFWQAMSWIGRDLREDCLVADSSGLREMQYSTDRVSRIFDLAAQLGHMPTRPGDPQWKACLKWELRASLERVRAMEDGRPPSADSRKIPGLRFEGDFALFGGTPLDLSTPQVAYLRLYDTRGPLADQEVRRSVVHSKRRVTRKTVANNVRNLNEALKHNEAPFRVASLGSKPVKRDLRPTKTDRRDE